jgi:hypothetical protein
VSAAVVFYFCLIFEFLCPFNLSVDYFFQNFERVSCRKPPNQRPRKFRTSHKRTTRQPRQHKQLHRNKSKKCSIVCVVEIDVRW